ncbi:DUF2958 domain-containing protein [Sinorhizobium chiapasense]
MELLTPELRKQLVLNNTGTNRGFDHFPVVKFFLPGTGATWLFTELEDDDRLFGLCDLGLGEPELGYASLEEIQSVRSRLGLAVERDLHWTATAPLSVYNAAARAAGRIVDTL